MKIKQRRLIEQLIIILLFYLIYQWFHIRSLVVWVFQIILPVLIAFLFRMLMDPFIDMFCYSKRKVVCIVLYSLIMVIVLLLLYLLLPNVIQQCMTFYQTYDINHLDSYIHPFFKPIYQFLESFGLLHVILDYLQSITNSMVYWLSNITLGYGISFYLVYDDVTLEGMLKKINVKHQELYLELLKKLKGITQSFFKANVIDFIIFFIVSFAIFHWIGLDYAIYLALFISATNLISYIGPYIGGIPIAIYAYFTSTMVGNLTTIAIFLMQLLESNFLQPILFKKCISTNPVLLIVALSICGDLFGIIGMILAPLLLAYLMEVINTIKLRFHLEKE